MTDGISGFRVVARNDWNDAYSVPLSAFIGPGGGQPTTGMKARIV